MKKICRIFYVVFISGFCLFLLSCGLEENKKISSKPRKKQITVTKQPEKRVVSKKDDTQRVKAIQKTEPVIISNPCREQTEAISTLINQKKWRPIILQMTKDFSFRYGDRVYKGKKKADGGKPFRNSIKRKDFIAYSHIVTEVRKINQNKYIVDADATLEITYKTRGRKESNWPLCFTWIKKGDKWKLASVNYPDKRKFIVTKQPDKAKNPPSRAYATQKAASKIRNESNYGNSNETQRKAKRSIKDKIKNISRQNRSR